jgi:hypothetical protein
MSASSTDEWREGRFGPLTPPCSIDTKIGTPSPFYAQAATLTFSVPTDAIVFRICEAIW